MGKVKVATREGLFAQDCIEVVKPVADCCTPMGWAMSLAKDKVVDWVNSHNSAADPVPVVINISDGCPTDSEDDVRRYARFLMVILEFSTYTYQMILQVMSVSHQIQVDLRVGHIFFLRFPQK